MRIWTLYFGVLSTIVCPIYVKMKYSKSIWIIITMTISPWLTLAITTQSMSVKFLCNLLLTCCIVTLASAPTDFRARCCSSQSTVKPFAQQQTSGSVTLSKSELACVTSNKIQEYITFILSYKCVLRQNILCECWWLLRAQRGWLDYLTAPHLQEYTILVIHFKYELFFFFCLTQMMTASSAVIRLSTIDLPPEMLAA